MIYIMSEEYLFTFLFFGRTMSLFESTSPGIVGWTLFKDLSIRHLSCKYTLFLCSKKKKYTQFSDIQIMLLILGSLRINTV